MKCDPDCMPNVDRRRFIKASTLAVAATTLPQFVHAGVPSKTTYAETVVAEFYNSLSASQRAAICRDFSDAARSRANANWHVTTQKIDDSFYSLTQRVLIKEIVRSVTSEEGYERLIRQTDFDDGGLGAYSVGMFGDPSKDAFQWLLTGRHLTLRADGNTLERSAFGGPMIYGHGEETARENLFHYQTKQVNEVFRALNKDQAGRALLEKAPKEDEVKPQGKSGKFPGLAVSEMTGDQKALVKSTLKTVLAPYRDEDADEALAIIEASGGIDQLRFAFYSQEDLGNDKVWDIWRIEGPTAVIHFRGAPHVHAYIHIAG